MGHQIQVLQQEVTKVQVLLSLVSQQRVAAEAVLNKVVLDYQVVLVVAVVKDKVLAQVFLDKEIQVDEAAVAAAEAAAVVLLTLVQVSLLETEQLTLVMVSLMQEAAVVVTQVQQLHQTQVVAAEVKITVVVNQVLLIEAAVVAD